MEENARSEEFSSRSFPLGMKPALSIPSWHTMDGLVTADDVAVIAVFFRDFRRFCPPTVPGSGVFSEEVGQ